LRNKNASEREINIINNIFSAFNCKIYCEKKIGVGGYHEEV